jgi:hypothetical protein
LCAVGRRWYLPATVDFVREEVSRNVMTIARTQPRQFAARRGGVLVATLLLAP